MVNGVQSSTVSEMSVLPGAYEGQPDAVSAPVMDGRGGQSSIRSGFRSNLAMMAILFLLLLLSIYSIFNMVPP